MAFCILLIDILSRFSQTCLQRCFFYYWIFWNLFHFFLFFFCEFPKRIKKSFLISSIVPDLSSLSSNLSKKDSSVLWNKQIQSFIQQFILILKHNIAIKIYQNSHKMIKKNLRWHLIDYLNVTKAQFRTVDESQIALNLKRFLLESKHTMS